MSDNKKEISVTLEGSLLYEVLMFLQEINNKIHYEPWLKASPELQRYVLGLTDDVFYTMMDVLENYEGPKEFENFKDALFYFTKGRFSNQIAYYRSLRFLQRYGPLHIKSFIERAYYSLDEWGGGEDLDERFNFFTNEFPIKETIYLPKKEKNS